MQDSAVVAAVVAGDTDGFGAAYDQYAASLYGYCHRVLPGPEAAEAVLDTCTAPASALPTSPAALAGATSAAPPAGRGTPGPTASPSGRSPSPSASASSSPAQGYLLVAPARLVLTSKSGTPASGFIRLTASNGPVPHYTVRLAADPGRVKVVPADGSLPVNGTVEVTVTVTSKVALTTHVVVEPGNLTVTVVYKLKPQPAPKPSPPPPA